MVMEERSYQSGDYNVYSLSQLAEGLRFALYRSFPDQLWVKAEIAKLNIYAGSGHAYLDMVEKKDGKTQAQMRGIIWANDLSDIRRKFEDVTREQFREGLTILFSARVNFHEIYGFSLWISDVEPAFTLGEFSRLKVRTIERLQEEKLIDLNKQLGIPDIPLRIAVISAETSKGYLDFIKVIRQHPVPYRFEITLFPALLQGDKAVDSIRDQLKKIHDPSLSLSRVLGKGREESPLQGVWGYNPASSFDLVAIVRGGGDEIGLTCFDNYDLSRDICQFPLPIITGIGHSTNETVVEMVAARNKITPTEVGYYLLGLLDAVSDELDDMQLRIMEMTREIFAGKKIDLAGLSDTMIREVYSFVRQHRQQLEHTGENLSVHLYHLLGAHADQLAHMENQVRNLDPKRVLQRGFSLTYDQHGNILRDAGSVSAGDKISTELQSGTIQSTIDP